MPTTRNLRDGTLTIRDGAATPATATVDLDEGNLSYTERRPGIAVRDRGVLDHWREGDEQPSELSFTMKFQSFSQHAAPTPYNALTQTGGAASWISDSNANSDVYTVELQFVLADVNSVFSGSETLTFAEFKPEEIAFAEGDEYNTLACSGRALVVAPTLS